MISRNIRRLYWLSFCALACSASAQTLEVDLLSPEQVEHRFLELKTAEDTPEGYHPRKSNQDRAAVLRKMFADAGCGADRFSEQEVKKSNLPNLSCLLPGSSDDTIVITAHYDKVKAGEGALDNWSGAAMLPSLYQTLRGHQHHTTLLFVLTTDEEKGLLGAKNFIKQASDEFRHHVVANINIDCVGYEAGVRIWAPRADARLTDAVARVAAALGVPITGMDLSPIADADSSAFLEQDIPVIDFHSLNSKSLRLLHGDSDRMELVRPEVYYDTYRLLSFYLAFLDSRVAAGGLEPAVAE